MHYPAWKYVLIVVVLAIAGLYALPNLYPDEPAVQISSESAATVLDETVLSDAETALTAAGIDYHDPSFGDNSALLRLNDGETQLQLKRCYAENLGATMWWR